MSIPNEYRNVLQLLLQASKQARVRWQEDAAERFFVALEKFSVRVREWFTEVDAYVVVELINARGEEMDRFTVSKQDADYETVSSLCRAAQHSARNIDEAIRQLEEELSTDGTIGLERTDEKPDISF